jgi:hypothetical protein
MSYTLDLSHDLELVYGLDTFTLKVESAADITLANCVLTEPVDTREAEPTDGQVPQMDQMVVWPTYKSPTQPPLGSVLVDGDGVYWTILAIRRKQHVETWEARTRNLSVVAGVVNTITLLKAIYSHGRAGEAKATWQGLFSGQTPATAEDTVPGRIQPATELAQIRYGAEWQKETYRVLLEKSIPLHIVGGEYRMVDTAGNWYRILEMMGAERIDRLPCVIVVRVSEGRGVAKIPLLPPQFPVP